MFRFHKNLNVCAVSKSNRLLESTGNYSSQRITVRWRQLAIQTSDVFHVLYVIKHLRGDLMDARRLFRFLFSECAD